MGKVCIPLASVQYFLYLYFATASVRSPIIDGGETSAICCGHGKVRLWPLPSYPPPELLHLVSSTSTLSRLFLTNIRRFNTAFAFASCGGATAADTLRLRQFRSNGPYTFVVQGQFHHYLGSAQPLIQNSVPRYSQIYFYSGEDEQLGYRLNNVSELQEGDLRRAASMVQRVISREHRYAASSAAFVRGRCESATEQRKMFQPWTTAGA